MAPTMNTTGGSPRTTEPPGRPTRLSATASSPSPPSPLSEGFESGTLGAFASAVATCVPGGCGWSAVTTAAHTGTFSAFSPDLANITDQRLTTINPVAIPAGGLSNATLTFWHRYTFEGSGANYYDGGVLETSTDGGATW